MNELNKLNLEELRIYKSHIIDEIYKLKKIKRQIDIVIKRKLKND